MPELIKFTNPNRGVFLNASFINDIMPDANGDFVKVYIFALMKAENGESCSHAQIAEKLNMLEGDVMKAFAYWYEKGAMDISDGEVLFKAPTASQKQTAAAPQGNTAAVVQPQAVPTKTQKTYSRPNTDRAANAIANDKAVSNMCSLAEEIWGKPLSPQEASTLFWFYDELKFPLEVILMLLEYCASKDKRNMRYVETIALAWHEKGIETAEKADSYIKNEMERGSYFNIMRKTMGITDRTLSRSEEAFLTKWHDQYGMTEEMVALAYEYCVLQTSKLSFPYMDKIMERWFKNGITTVQQAETDNENFKRQNASRMGMMNTPQQEVFNDNINHSELEALVWEKLGKGGNS